MEIKTDFLVIGSGITGLLYALKVAKVGEVIIITKSTLEDATSSYAQGGIAAVMYSPDTYEKHIQDTLKAGAGLNDERIVRLTIYEGSERIKELIELGVSFDKNPDGTYNLAREGGHSEQRIFHHKDNTGEAIMQTLIHHVKKHSNIQIFENCLAIDLITQHHLGVKVTRETTNIECFGAYVLNINTNEIFKVLSQFTLLATGGCGALYQTTTNPQVATGDGIAMAKRACAYVENMEFIQFHPTAFYDPSSQPSFLITEALRGAGAVLKNHDGEEFMSRYHPAGSLAPRDIVARAIDHEMKIKGTDHVFLDARHISKKVLLDHFPNIYAFCLSKGIDMTRDMIPVAPAAHYQVGGVKTNEWAQTTIRYLFAAGEVACTGLHGANRLASNSLLETIVFGHRAAQKTIELFKHSIHPIPSIPDWNAEGTIKSEEKILITQSKRELQQIMSNYVGIVRSDLRLERALRRLKILYEETEDLYRRSVVNKDIVELRNMINTAYLIITQAQARKQSIGLHYNIDYLPSQAT
ncbi:MAG: L-aspartate oxidase [Bacteroidales bacterium]|nr:L-aspartate oxidase [Bacteroidales bacterium]